MIISKLRRKFKDYFGHLFRGGGGEGRGGGALSTCNMGFYIRNVL